MAIDRWTQFSIDYPEIFAYLLGQVSSKFVADHRLMDLITLVNTIEPDTIQATETEADSGASGGLESDSLTPRQEEILRHLSAIKTSGWWDINDTDFNQKRIDTQALADGGLIFHLPNGRFQITERGEQWVTAHPQAATEPAGYTVKRYQVHKDSRLIRVVNPNTGLDVAVISTDMNLSPHAIGDVIADTLDTETVTLRAENARLQAELQAARDEDASTVIKMNSRIVAAKEHTKYLQLQLSEVHNALKEIRSMLRSENSDAEGRVNMLVRKVGVALNYAPVEND